MNHEMLRYHKRPLISFLIPLEETRQSYGKWLGFACFRNLQRSCIKIITELLGDVGHVRVDDVQDCGYTVCFADVVDFLQGQATDRYVCSRVTSWVVHISRGSRSLSWGANLITRSKCSLQDRGILQHEIHYPIYLNN